MSDDDGARKIYLGIIDHEVRAIYYRAAMANAWLAGVDAAYAQGIIVELSHVGPVDARQLEDDYWKQRENNRKKEAGQ